MRGAQLEGGGRDTRLSEQPCQTATGVRGRTLLHGRVLWNLTGAENVLSLVNLVSVALIQA